MANPRDLAEQAFALLQDALRDSEARASELDEQLKRKRAPKNRLEEQLDVLTHRLEKIESERAQWERQAGHLEEVAEAERVKVAQLKKKLEIAESGPEKLTKKEVNYWRERSESFDTETKEYRDRLAALLRTLRERDAEIAQLQNSPPPAAPAVAGEPPDAIADELRRQVQQRDQWLADLRLELHDLRTQAAGTPEPSIETLAEIETLRHQAASLDKALADAHNTRAAAQADLHRAEQDLAARERACREAEAAAERAQSLVRERDHRLVELSAQFEQLRNESHQREHHFRAESAEHTDQIAALSRELMELRSRAEQDRQAVANNSAELANARDARTLAEQRLAGMAAALERAEAALLERTQQHGEAQAAIARLEDHVSQRERELAERADQVRQLGQRLAEQEQQFTSVSGDLERAKATAAANGREIASLRETLQTVGRDLDQVRGQNRSLEAAEAEARAKADTLAAELGALRERATQELSVARQQLQTQAATVRERFEAELSAVREQLEGQLTAARERVALLEAERNGHRRQADSLSDEVNAAREQIAGLEAELKEEKEHAENLGELANERREHMTKLQEQLEEAEERYAEADWRLGKAAHFERLVQRRKGLIAKLIAALRAKMKANVALKAGLDGLRTYKASAEVNQQKLLQRLDKLKAELDDAEETIKKHQGATHTKEELDRVESRASSLEERLNTQAELIQSLEAELKTARLAHPKGDDHAHQEIERLRAELETKNQIIATLEADADEQQRKLGKLRGSESETMRLRAISEKDRTEIDALQREVAQLREALERQTSAATGENPELSTLLRDRDQTITRLMGTIKEHEATIKKVNESAEGWKRKYQFLSADAPEAYKSATEH